MVGRFSDYARALGAVPGLVVKTWLRDGATQGGVLLLAKRAAAGVYLGGDMVVGLIATSAFGEFRIQHYGVQEELSRITS